MLRQSITRKIPISKLSDASYPSLHFETYVSKNIRNNKKFQFLILIASISFQNSHSFFLSPFTKPVIKFWTQSSYINNFTKPFLNPIETSLSSNERNSISHICGNVRPLDIRMYINNIVVPFSKMDVNAQDSRPLRRTPWPKASINIYRAYNIDV